ncbi:hypothetical protein CYMTET_55202 [Cymbomonas tetramitiformis]|uniref:Uncharacterized protein n=1 Tax=Cymbomonas tetramitiformis TaxID=36881 RepID=A0AAE0ENX4_9CHLO|nr:hypothetical protein CYMTET_55202 [Cymbomonas tetramitiformis]
MNYYCALYGSKNCGVETKDAKDAPSLTEVTAAACRTRWPEKEVAMDVLNERLGSLVAGLDADDPLTWEWAQFHDSLSGCLAFLRSRRQLQQHSVVDARYFKAVTHG